LSEKSNRPKKKKLGGGTEKAHRTKKKTGGEGELKKEKIFLRRRGFLQGKAGG